MSQKKPQRPARTPLPKLPGRDPKSDRLRKEGRIPRGLLWLGLGLIVLMAGAAVFIWTPRQAERDTTGSVLNRATSAEPPYVPRERGLIEFNRDIAPIILRECAYCHRSGQAAPFELLTYRDVAKRGQQIVEVTQSGFMPPWLPEHGFGDFANERRLTPDQKGLIQQWVREGSPEGTSAAPLAPQFAEGWTLGRPDLVVTLSEDYVLGPEGTNVYRNFVLAVPGTEDRFVRALEFSPGNLRIVHHAFVKLDRQRASRLLDAQDAELGFSGMSPPSEIPNGQFLSWQPGRLPIVAPDGLAWLLPKGGDLILQLHMNRTGKIEPIRPSIGLYFTNAPPTKTCVRATLMSVALDIPAGDSGYVATDSLTLPADVEIISLLPHAHYLAKEVQSFAVRPDGTKQWLLLIKRWDFNWQSDYQFARPVPLPKGSTIHLRYTYDNSTNNLRNPNVPPKRVTYGTQSSDEMCELWLQMLPVRPRDASVLSDAVNEHVKSVYRLGAEHRLAVNPNDAEAHLELGIMLLDAGKRQEALSHWQRAAQLDPTSDKPHFQLGVLLRSEDRFRESRVALETALRLNPKNSKAYGHLGFVLAELGELADAERNFREGLRLDPTDTLLQDALRELDQVRRKAR